MISKKQLNEHFNWYETTKNEKWFHLYDKKEEGKYTKHKYYGYITLEKGKATHVLTGKSTNKIDELLSICKEWADSVPYASDTYSPDYVPGYTEELQVREHLYSLGFENSNGVYNYHSYSHQLSTMISNSNVVSLTVDRNDKYEKEDDHKLDISVICGENSWIDFTAKTTEEAVNKINSVLSTFYLEIVTRTAGVLSKMKLDAMDKEEFDKIVIKKVDGCLNVHKTSLKEQLITMLEKQLEELKK